MQAEKTGSSDNFLALIPSYIVPGLVIGCSILDSLLYSTLECFYSNNECLSIIINYTYSREDITIPRINITPLIYDSASSRFPPNISLSAIFKEIMVEQWNSLFSFDRYYNACAPSQCVYPEKVRAKTFSQVIIALLSSITGLISTVRLLVPSLLEFIFALFKPKIRQEKSNLI